jgi:hypothetical protein
LIALDDVRYFIDDIPKWLWAGIGCDLGLFAVLVARVLLHQQPF